MSIALPPVAAALRAALFAEQPRLHWPLEVRTFNRLDQLAEWREPIAELARASIRPSPFLNLDFLEAFEKYDEFAVPGSEPLFLLAFSGARLCAFLPLRRVPERIFHLEAQKLRLFAHHTCDRPSLIARPEDAEACAAAMLSWLVEREPEWTFLEFIEQPEDSPLVRAAQGLFARHLYCRDYPNNPNGTLSLAQGYEAWLRSMGNLRRNVGHRGRSLAAAGRVSLWTSAGHAGARDFLELYLDLEARSWKVQAKAGITRHPRRIELFRALVSPPQDSEPVFHWLLLDGVPVAGTLALRHGDTQFLMELAYDSSYQQLAPGNVLMVLMIRDAVARGVRALNLLGNYAYFKSQWKAEISPTAAVQIYRRPSLHYFKARGGELKRQLKGPEPTQLDADKNLSKPEVVALPPPESRAAARELARQVLARAQAQGARPEILEGPALWAGPPFETKGKPS